MATVSAAYLLSSSDFLLPLGASRHAIHTEHDPNRNVLLARIGSLSSPAHCWDGVFDLVR